MGATGSGKSTVCLFLLSVRPPSELIPPRFAQFINLVSGSNLRVGQGLRSCTDRVQIANSFYLDGRRVVLIDTPGFDDTTRSDTDVLKLVAAFLGVS